MTWQTSFLAIADCNDVRGTAVVIDVLRAFSTAAWAFELGVERIILTDSLDEALVLKSKIEGSLALKDGEPAPGFDLTNSPVMLRQRAGLAGRTLIQRTTHGTTGAVAARHAEQLLCASFLCAEATAALIRRAEPSSVAFVVTGDEGSAGEDRACADYIASLLLDPATPPQPYLERAARSRAAATLMDRVAAGSRGTHPDDVRDCLRSGVFPFALVAQEEEGLLTLRRVDVL